MKVLLHPESIDSLPTVRCWLHHGRAAHTVAESLPDKDEGPSEKLRRLTEENVLMKLAHLKTHPTVAGAMARGELTAPGLVFDIGSGVIRIAEEGLREFVPVTAAHARVQA